VPRRRPPELSLVTDKHGRMVVPWRLTARFRELIAESELPPIVLHEGRPAANSLGAKRASTRVRQSWMGHSTLELTERTYDPTPRRPRGSREAGCLVLALEHPTGLAAMQR
jgi:integrase